MEYNIVGFSRGIFNEIVYECTFSSLLSAEKELKSLQSENPHIDYYVIPLNLTIPLNIQDKWTIKHTKK